MRVIFCNIPRANRANILRSSSVDNLLAKLGSSNYSEDPETAREWFGRSIRITNQTSTTWQPTHVITYTPYGVPPGDVLKNSPTVYVVTRADDLGGGCYRMTAELNGVATALMRASGNNKIVSELVRYSADDTVISSTDEPIDGMCEWTEEQVSTYNPALSDCCVVITTYRRPTRVGTDWSTINQTGSAVTKGGVVATVPQSYKVVKSDGTEYSAVEDALQSITYLLIDDSEHSTKYVYRIQLVPKVFISATSSLILYEGRGGGSGVGLYMLEPYRVGTDLSPSIPASYFTATDNLKTAYHGKLRVRSRRELLCECPLDYAAVSGVRLVAHCSIQAGVNLYVDVTMNNSLSSRITIPAYEVTALGDGVTVWWEGAKAQILTQSATSILSLGIGIAATVASGGVGALALIGAVGSAGAQAASIYQQYEAAEKQVVKMGLGAGMLNLNDGSVPLLELDVVRYKDTAAVTRYYRKHGYAGYWSLQGLPKVRDNYNAYSGTAVLHEVRNLNSGLSSVSIQDINDAMAEELQNGVIIYESTTYIADTDTTGNPMPSS